MGRVVDQELAGTVEQVGCEGACGFGNIEELGKIMLGEGKVLGENANHGERENI